MFGTTHATWFDTRTRAERRVKAMVMTPRVGSRTAPGVADSYVGLDTGQRFFPDNGRSSENGDVEHEIERLARALGWFSLCLGLVQIVAPRKVAQMVGIPGDADERKVMRAVGLREIANGLGILTQAKPTPWLWARVGGDAMDLALLSSAMTSPRAEKSRVAAATAAVLGIAAADTLVSTRITRAPDAAFAAGQDRDVQASAAITINAPLAEVFRFWEDPRNLPRFMRDTATIEATGERKTRWSLSAPAGVTVEWDVEITESSPNERISWRTGEGSPVGAIGTVRFREAPRGQGTEVIFDTHFTPPGGELGKTIGGLFAEALETRIGNDLRRVKQLIELGEIVQSDDSIITGPNPAQPAPQSEA
jgi:uncharacterized membrane protein